MNSSSQAVRSPLSMLSVVNISIVVGMVLLFGWLSRDMIGGMLSHITPAPAGSMRGEWVGILMVGPQHASTASDLTHQAAIRFKLSTTDSFLGKYGGHGEITLAGGNPQTLEVRDLWPQSNPADGSFRGGIWLDSYTPDQASTDLISGGIKGTFEPGTLTLRRMNDLGYSMQGTLSKGTDADYQRLVQQLR